MVVQGADRPCRRPIPDMKMTDHPRNLTGFRFLARGAGAAVILIGGLVLAGWAFDVAVLKSLIPGLTAMNPGGTALAFLLAGVSLWAQASAGATPRRRAVGIACAAGVLLIGLARVGGYLAGWDGGPDQLLFRAALEREAVRVGLPNRMSPNTAAAFVLVGLALDAARRADPSPRHPARPVPRPGGGPDRAAGPDRLCLQRHLPDGRQAVHPDGAEHRDRVRDPERRHPLRAPRSRDDGRRQQHRRRRGHGASAAARGDPDPRGRGLGELARPAARGSRTR